ncbi:glycoside hydrolase family protein [Phocaeicola sp.]
MKKLLFVFPVLLFGLFVRAQDGTGSGLSGEQELLFERAVQCVKRFEGWHTGRDSYIGWGHKLLPGEKLDSHLTRAQADSLLRADLRKRCVTFRRFGKDVLLLSVLSYNVGEYRLLGSGKIPKSNLIKKLERDDRDIYKEYISYRKYRGKVVRSIERRRKCEFALLYIP